MRRVFLLLPAPPVSSWLRVGAAGWGSFGVLLGLASLTGFIVEVNVSGAAGTPYLCSGLISAGLVCPNTLLETRRPQRRRHLYPKPSAKTLDKNKKLFKTHQQRAVGGGCPPSRFGPAVSYAGGPEQQAAKTETGGKYRGLGAVWLSNRSCWWVGRVGVGAGLRLMTDMERSWVYYFQTGVCSLQWG